MTTILVTGGTGCIGATAIHQLLREHSDIERIEIISRAAAPHLLQLWQGKDIDSRVGFHSGTVADREFIQHVMQTVQPDRIVHLGALQSPACAADPDLGLEINLRGTLHLLELIKATLPNLQRFVFASSAAVYGPRAFYSNDTIPESVPLSPPNLYGVWKEASEHLTRLFHDETQIPTVCLRLNTTYGPGRDQGLTSAVTTAMKQIAAGPAAGTSQPFVMPYQGRENYHYVEDVGLHFARCTMAEFSGYAALNIKGETIEVADFLQHIRAVADGMGLGAFCDLSIADDAVPNLFVSDLDHSAMERTFPGISPTSIPDGIRKSLEFFTGNVADD